MNYPIQNTSADIEIKPEEQLSEPFVSALKNHKYEILFFSGNKTHPFYCSEYDCGPVHRAEVWIKGPGGSNQNEWIFFDVIMDTSKRDPQGKPTLVRMTYHPQISLVNVPFMILPAANEKEPDHIPEDVSVLPCDEEIKSDPEEGSLY